MKEMGCEANIGFGRSPKAALFSFWMQPQTLSKYKYVREKKGSNAVWTHNYNNLALT